MDNFLTIFSRTFPLVKIIEIKDKLYAYDAQSHLLTNVTINQLKSIYDFYVNDTITDDHSIADLLDKNIFSPNINRRITYDTEKINDLIENQMRNYFPRRFMLEITEQCTLRCSYCFYTTSDNTKRGHSNNTIKKRTALKAIDYYYDKYVSALDKVIKNKSKAIKLFPPNMSWWGGEPLLEFDILKETKSYFESLNWVSLGIKKSSFLYSITTNLTVLTDEILDFVVENNITLMVSLDGDKEGNDKNRVFADGKGSFDTVIDNINLIISKYPNYAKKHLMIQSVLADNVNISKSKEFLKNHFNLSTSNKCIIDINLVSQRHEKELIPRSSTMLDASQELNDFSAQMCRLGKMSEAELFNELSLKKQLYRMLRGILDIEQQLVFDNPINRDRVNSTYSCALGIDSIFVSCHGQIHCCCKVDHSFPLGDIFTGLNKKTLYSVYSSYLKGIELKCENCWALGFCKICPAIICWDGEFIMPNSRECLAIKNNVSIELAKFIILSEQHDIFLAKLRKFFKNKRYNFKDDSKPITINELNYEKD